MTWQIAVTEADRFQLPFGGKAERFIVITANLRIVAHVAGAKRIFLVLQLLAWQCNFFALDLVHCKREHVQIGGVEIANN